MKKTFSLIFGLLVAYGLFAPTFITQASVVVKEVVPSAPKASAALQNCINQYKKENYIGAMQDLQELLKKDKNNNYAKYYLALSYTQLGYRDKAQELYQELSQLKSKEPVISYYSQRALYCLGNNDSPMCVESIKGKYIAPKTTEIDLPSAPVDDMTKFIQSGQTLHPSVQDRVTKERMERKIQEEEYAKKQRENLSAVPTTEEIAFSLQTLAKIGFNPFNQQTSSLIQANPYNALTLNSLGLGMNNISTGSNNDVAKMLLYSQLTSPQNNFFNGI